MHPGKKNEIETRSKRGQNEITDRPLKVLGPHVPNPRPQVHSLLHPLPSTHFRTHFSTQFRTCERQPLKRACSALRTHASQMVAPPLKHTCSALHRRQPNNKRPLKRTRQPCKHARLVQVRGKARCRLEPAVAKETSSLKIAKHTVNAPRRIRKNMPKPS